MPSWFTATLTAEVHVENHFKHFDFSARTEENEAGENLLLAVGLDVTWKTHVELCYDLWTFRSVYSVILFSRVVKGLYYGMY